jgi:hypothetical protein
MYSLHQMMPPRIVLLSTQVIQELFRFTGSTKFVLEFLRMFFSYCAPYLEESHSRSPLD